MWSGSNTRPGGEWLGLGTVNGRRMREVYSGESNDQGSCDCGDGDDGHCGSGEVSHGVGNGSNGHYGGDDSGNDE